jgi:hypothetical protein
MPYRQGRSRAWLKIKNPSSLAANESFEATQKGPTSTRGNKTAHLKRVVAVHPGGFLVNVFKDSNPH